MALIVSRVVGLHCWKNQLPVTSNTKLIPVSECIASDYVCYTVDTSSIDSRVSVIISDANPPASLLMKLPYPQPELGVVAREHHCLPLLGLVVLRVGHKMLVCTETCTQAERKGRRENEYIMIHRSLVLCHV